MVGTMCGATENWILMFNRSTYGMTLFGRWTQTVDSIPPIPALPNENHVIHKAVISPCFSGTSWYYNVVVIYGEKKEMASYNLESKQWGFLGKAGTWYDDLICHDGAFYAVDEYGKVVHYRFDDSGCHGRQLVERWTFAGQKLYLMVVDGDLYLIIRYIRSTGTHLFKVYVLNRHRFQVADLEDWAVLLNQTQAVALPATEYKGLRPNCIYFRDDCTDHLAFVMEEQYIEPVERDDAEELNRIWQELYLSA